MDRDFRQHTHLPGELPSEPEVYFSGKCDVKYKYLNKDRQKSVMLLHISKGINSKLAENSPLYNLSKTSAQLKRALKFSKNCGESGFWERKKKTGLFVKIFL